MTGIDFSEFDDLFSNMKTAYSSKGATTAPSSVNADTNKTAVETAKVQTVNKDVNNTGALVSGQTKMQQIFVEMNNLFVERDELIRLMLLAITTGTNLLMLGPPGTARIDINA